MDEKQVHKLIAAAEAMRADLFNEHCAGAINQEEAVVHLASQLMFLAQVVLGALYNGDMEKVKAHWLASAARIGAKSAPSRLQQSPHPPRMPGQKPRIKP